MFPLSLDGFDLVGWLETLTLALAFLRFVLRLVLLVLELVLALLELFFALLLGTEFLLEVFVVLLRLFGSFLEFLVFALVVRQDLLKLYLFGDFLLSLLLVELGLLSNISLLFRNVLSDLRLH